MKHHDAMYNDSGRGVLPNQAPAKTIGGDGPVPVEEASKQRVPPNLTNHVSFHRCVTRTFAAPHEDASPERPLPTGEAISNIFRWNMLGVRATRSLAMSHKCNQAGQANVRSTQQMWSALSASCTSSTCGRHFSYTQLEHVQYSYHLP